MKTFLWSLVGLAFGASVALAAAPPGVAWEQRLGETVPRELRLHDPRGRERALGDWLGHKPVVLWFGYARCPQLCSVTSDAMVMALRQIEPNVGREFDVVMVSIDPDEPRADALAKWHESVGRYGRTGAEAGWTYLNADAATIAALTSAAGFHFTYDARSRQFAHPSGFMVLTPDGKISAYFPGVDFALASMAAAISRAGRRGIGAEVADFALACFRGEGVTGRYGLIIWRTLGVAVALTVLAVGGGIGWMLWTERRAQKRARHPGQIAATDSGGRSGG